MAPQVGLEPTTLRLTAECSAIELLRNKRPHIVLTKTMCRARSVFITKGTGSVNRAALPKLALGKDLREYLQP